jgi:hypothetical protein
MPVLMRAFAVLFRLIENSRDTDLIVRRASDRVVVARAGWTIIQRGKGMNSVRVRLDPAHSDLAPYLVRKALGAVLEKSPDLRVDLFVAHWMPSVAKEAESLGFVHRTSNRTMGMKL